MDFEKDENFEVELFEPTGGATIGRINRTAVTITNDDEFNSIMNKMMLMTHLNVDSMRVHNETWGQQLKDAMNVNGGDVENATAGDYVMHFLTFGFKVHIKGMALCNDPKPMFLSLFSDHICTNSPSRHGWRVALFYCVFDHDRTFDLYCWRLGLNLWLLGWLARQCYRYVILL